MKPESEQYNQGISQNKELKEDKCAVIWKKIMETEHIASTNSTKNYKNSHVLVGVAILKLKL
jgi:hypothetical protein